MHTHTCAHIDLHTHTHMCMHTHIHTPSFYLSHTHTYINTQATYSTHLHIHMYTKYHSIYTEQSLDSMLIFAITIWYGSAIQPDRNKLNRIVCMSSKIIGCELPLLESIYT